MIRFFIYEKATGLITCVVSGSTWAVGDQTLAETYEAVYGLDAEPGQYYNASTGTVQETAP